MLERAREKVAGKTQQLDGLMNEREELEARSSLRERVIHFQNYGLTVSAVVLAVITTIGVIVSSLTGGLKSVVKGVEHGFKTLGSKIGGILQGLVDSVLGFVFEPARSVIGFLSENAFILIMDVAISMFEQIKKKN